MLHKTLISFLTIVSICCMATDAQAAKKEIKKSKKVAKTEQKADSTGSKPKVKAGSIESVIKAGATKQEGLFTVYNQDNKFYFMIPERLLGRDILVVNRISKSAAGLRTDFEGYAGDQINDAMIRLKKSPDGKKLFVENIKTYEMPRDTVGDMYQAVIRSNVQPIINSFEIKATNAAKDSLLIDVTELLNGDNELISFGPSFKETFKLNNYQKESSYVKSVKTFPINTEIKTVKTYMHSPENPYTRRSLSPTPATFELNSSFLLLPEQPMQPRYTDSRVGYFSERYVDFDKNPQGVKNVSMITRWRLEPKPEDVEKYKRGELVEPAKPIIYYIDPATPQKWIPYLIQGVNDWEPVFRKAGFKNAIMALEAPVNDSTWSLEDARHSAIVYKPSNTPNASGPHNCDPRSGEIMESHINWYHNIMLILRNWYMLQAGVNDSRAQQMVLPDELMGQLIRFVSSHEVGHTLGLRHNFGATSQVPVDSLRSATYLKKYGHTPSIMDYSRFNYVVQPEDNVDPNLLFPRIQDYDEWAIEWGYRRFPDMKTPEAEAEKLNNWIIEKQKNPRLWFGHELNRDDPRSQAEDLGDNQMKANALGIKNLKRVIAALPKWTATPNEGYKNLDMMATEVRSQYNRYIGHVIKWIGGVYENPVTQEQADVVYSFVEKSKQKEAMAFLERELFTAPTWLFNDELVAKTGMNSLFVMSSIYNRHLNNLLNRSVLSKLINAENNLGKQQAYTMSELYADLNRIIWSQSTPDIYRRELQKSYVEALINLSGLESAKGLEAFIVSYNAGRSYSDIESMAVYQLRQLNQKLASMSSADPMVAAHYQYLKHLINNVLVGK